MTAPEVRGLQEVALLTLELIMRLQERDAHILDRAKAQQLTQEINDFIEGEIRPRIEPWADVEYRIGARADG